MAKMAGGGKAGPAVQNLLDWLKDRLGYRFEADEQIDDRDRVILNLARLRALADARGANPEAVRNDVEEMATEAGFWNEARNLLDYQVATNADIQMSGVMTTFGAILDSERQAVAEAVPPSPDDISYSRPDPYWDKVGPGNGYTRPDPYWEQGTQPTTTADPEGGNALSGGGSPTYTGGDDFGPDDVATTPDGTARQVPGDYEVWQVDGRDIYLAYTIPDTDIPLVWRVEDPERMNAIFGDNQPAIDRQLSTDEFQQLSPYVGGLTAELANTDEHPWTQFLSQFSEAAKRRPWLSDPTVLATMANAYLEGRTPTQDEIAQTDWWNEHSADERNLMEAAVSSGDAEMAEQVRDMYKQWLGPEVGKLTTEQATSWVRRLQTDPDAAGKLLDTLKNRKRQLFHEDYGEDATYEDIVEPVRNLASNVWGQPVDDETLLIDLANTRDYSTMAARLRRTGMQRGVRKVVNDARASLSSKPLGEQIVRSA